MIGSTWMQTALTITLFAIMAIVAVLICFKKINKYGLIWATVCSFLLTWILFGRLV